MNANTLGLLLLASMGAVVVLMARLKVHPFVAMLILTIVVFLFALIT